MIVRDAIVRAGEFAEDEFLSWAGAQNRRPKMSTTYEQKKEKKSKLKLFMGKS